MRIPDSLALQLVQSSRRLSEDQIAFLRSQEHELHKSMQELVTHSGLITEGELTKLYARKIQVPYVDLDLISIDPTFLLMMPERIARMYNVVIFSVNPDGSSNIAFSDKPSTDDIDTIKKYVKKPINVYLASQSSLKRWLNQYRMTDSHIGPLVTVKSSKKQIANDATGLELANELLKQAIQLSATDIHIEPHEHNAQIRLRIDGRLQGYHPLSLEQFRIMSNYLMHDFANLRDSRKQTPKEGVFTHAVGDKKYRITIAVLPVIDGEKISLQIQELTQEIRSLMDLGLWGPSLQRVERALAHTTGLILVAGPGKSGKTTTLHALLKEKHSTHISMIAIEENQAFREPYASHVTIDQKRGPIFTAALNASLRHNPDVILIQRIQETQTAALVIEAAQQNKLMCGGIVATSALESLSKLQHLGIKAHDIGSVLRCTIGQRVVRKLCQHCKVRAPVNETVAQKITAIMNTVPDYSMKDVHTIEKAAISAGLGEDKNPLSSSKKIQTIWTYNPEGCTHCNETGYSGQFGIFEVLEMTNEITSLLVGNKAYATLKTSAIMNGMIPMSIDGLVKVLRGITTLEEVEEAIRAIY